MNQAKTIAGLLSELVPKRGKSKAEVARHLGISGQLLGQYVTGRQKPKEDFYDRWELAFKEDLKRMLKTNVSQGTSNSRNDGKHHNHDIHAVTPTIDINMTIQALIAISKSNEVIAASNKEIGESNNTLSKTNDRLSSMLEKKDAIVDDLKGTLLTWEASILALQEFVISELSKLKNVSPESVSASLGIIEEEARKRVEKNGTHLGSGKQGTYGSG